MARHLTVYTGPTEADLARMPSTLQTLPQWVLWRGADRVDEQTGEIKLNKIPIDPQTLAPADTTDPTTWGSFEHCCAALPVALEEWEHAAPGAYRGGGLGFVFTANDPYTGIDLDSCRNPQTGAIEPWAQEILADVQSYTEITPSRSGLHTLVQGVLPPRGRKKGKIEMYHERRFFTMTGWQLPQSPASVTACQTALTALHARVFGAMVTSQGPVAPGSVTLEDTALLTKARQAANGATFSRLYEAGDWAAYGSQSEADLGLCIRLAFWTQAQDQIDRLFRQSGLMRDKWDERRGQQTYGARTVQEALARQTEHYRPYADGHKQRNGLTPGPAPTDPYACPELPASATVDHERAAEASIFLDDYIAFSKKWAPRAYEGFHEAVGLFVLSTTAARRVKVELGPNGVYTSLYQALAARTSLYTKTTAVDIGLTLLRQAGLRSLLAHDDATPQAFLRSLTLYVPPDYAELSDEEQQAIRERLAFAGQKGWFYEEWGQHIQAMMQKDGPMAAFRGILRRLDDHKAEYDSATISRGVDLLHKPYVTLLANVTPADLKPFLRTQSPLWRDGYIARIAFITPGDTTFNRAPFPEGAMTLPRPLVTALASWHKRLGIPQLTLKPITKGQGKETGRYRPVMIVPHRETTYTLSPDVRTAFYAYDDALHTLMTQRKEEDLDGSYVRFPMKALRIAALLASLHDDSDRKIIWPAQWYRGQQIAERWRQDLHRMVQQVSEDETVTRESKGEQRVLAVLRKHGTLSIRDIHRWSKLAHADILQHLAVLSEAGVVKTTETPRAKKYSYALDGDSDE